MIISKFVIIFFNVCIVSQIKKHYEWGVFRNYIRVVPPFFIYLNTHAIYARASHIQTNKNGEVGEEVKGISTRG
jgi:hypothetical protein